MGHEVQGGRRTPEKWRWEFFFFLNFVTSKKKNQTTPFGTASLPNNTSGRSRFGTEPGSEPPYFGTFTRSCCPYCLVATQFTPSTESFLKEHELEQQEIKTR